MPKIEDQPKSGMPKELLAEIVEKAKHRQLKTKRFKFAAIVETDFDRALYESYGKVFYAARFVRDPKTSQITEITPVKKLSLFETYAMYRKINLSSIVNEIYLVLSEEPQEQLEETIDLLTWFDSKAKKHNFNLSDKNLGIISGILRAHGFSRILAANLSLLKPKPGQTMEERAKKVLQVLKTLGPEATQERKKSNRIKNSPFLEVEAPKAVFLAEDTDSQVAHKSEATATEQAIASDDNEFESELEIEPESGSGDYDRDLGSEESSLQPEIQEPETAQELQLAALENKIVDVNIEVNDKFEECRATVLNYVREVIHGLETLHDEKERSNKFATAAFNTRIDKLFVTGTQKLLPIEAVLSGRNENLSLGIITEDTVFQYADMAYEIELEVEEGRKAYKNLFPKSTTNTEKTKNTLASLWQQVCYAIDALKSALLKLKSAVESIFDLVLKCCPPNAVDANKYTNPDVTKKSLLHYDRKSKTQKAESDAKTPKNNSKDQPKADL